MSHGSPSASTLPWHQLPSPPSPQRQQRSFLSRPSSAPTAGPFARQAARGGAVVLRGGVVVGHQPATLASAAFRSPGNSRPGSATTATAARPMQQQVLQQQQHGGNRASSPRPWSPLRRPTSAAIPCDGEGAASPSSSPLRRSPSPRRATSPAFLRPPSPQLGRRVSGGCKAGGAGGASGLSLSRRSPSPSPPPSPSRAYVASGSGRNSPSRSQRGGSKGGASSLWGSAGGGIAAESVDHVLVQPLTPRVPDGGGEEAAGRSGGGGAGIPTATTLSPQARHHHHHHHHHHPRSPAAAVPSDMLKKMLDVYEGLFDSA